MKILIVHFNTPFMTECLIKSINKHIGYNCDIYIFDNSDKLPFTYKQGNISVIDNTNEQIINFKEWLKEYPNRINTVARINGWGSAKHAYTIEKCIDIICDDFILMDSDVLLKKNITDFIDPEYAACGEVKRTNGSKPRLLPFICYINYNMYKENNLHYFDERKINGLQNTYLSETYDTGGSFYDELIEHNLPIKEIKLEEYITHFKAGSWSINARNMLHRDTITATEWLVKNKNLFLNEDEDICFPEYMINQNIEKEKGFNLFFKFNKDFLKNKNKSDNVKPV